MLKSPFSRSKKRVVLDLGTSAIRLCELTNTNTGLQLTRYIQRDYNSDPSLDDDTKRELRAAALKEILKEAKIKTRKTIFSVPLQSVFARSRPLPPVPAHKVTQIVRYEIQQQIPFSLDQIALDYQILSRTAAGGYDVLMAAIKVDVVERRLEILRDTKCVIDAVDVSPLAAYNWLKKCGELESGEQECVALVDIGATTTDIIVERDGQYRNSRSLNIGGNDITIALADAFTLEFEKAEELKRTKAFAPTGDPKRDGRGGEVVGQVLSRMVGEIARSFSYFRSQPGGGAVNRVVLTGGGACLRNIVPYLQRELGVDVRIAQPLAGLAVGPQAQEINESPERAPVVLGLALRSVDTVAIGLNLIPPRILERSRRKQQLAYLAMSVAAMALIAASIVPIRAAQNKELLKQIEFMKERLASFDPQIPTDPEMPTMQSRFERELADFKRQVEDMQRKVNAYDAKYKSRVNWIDYLEAINSARPIEEGKSVWIASIETANWDVGPAGQTGRAAGGGFGGGLAGLAGGLGAGAGRRGDPADADTTTLQAGSAVMGFPGVGTTARQAGGLGSMMSFEEDDDDRGRGRRSRSQGAGAADMQTQAQIILQPDGFILRGVATDQQAILQFVQSLKDLEDPNVVIDPEKPVEEQTKKLFPVVEMPQQFVERVSATALINTSSIIGGAGAGAAGGFGGASRSRNRYEDDDEDRGGRGRGGGLGGGFGGLGGLGAFGGQRMAPATGYAPLTAPAGNYFSYRINLRFKMASAAAQPAPGAAAAPAAASPLQFRFGAGATDASDDSDDEDEPRRGGRRNRD